VEGAGKAALAGDCAVFLLAQLRVQPISASRLPRVMGGLMP
jgi:hypothetical protein